MLFSNLSANQEYLLKIQALTSSLYQENLVYPGVISEVRLQIGDTDNVVVDISCNDKPNDKSYIIMSSTTCLKVQSTINQGKNVMKI